LTFDRDDPQYSTLSQEDLDQAQLRQDLISNKVKVALEFVAQLGELTNVQDSQNPENDPAYKASVKILSTINEEHSSVEYAISFLHDIIEFWDPISKINKTPIYEPYFSTQWYLARDKNFYQAYEIDDEANIHIGNVLNHYSGKGVTIAIIDDGLDVNHIDLNKSNIFTYDIRTNSSDVSQTGYYDAHGTAVTGVIAASINEHGVAGIAPDSKIIFFRYRDDMSDSETIEMFQKASELGADIINCSWGTYNVSDGVKETIQNLARYGRDGKGILIVFASGNDDSDMGNDESAIPEVIAVGATTRDNLRAWYSNYGSNLDIVAPGGYDVGISTIDPMGDRGESELDLDYLLAYDPYSFMGTSASAPIVSGVLALLLEEKPYLTRAEIMERLKQSSDKIGNIDYDYNGWNRYYGYGKLNVQRLIDIE